MQNSLRSVFSVIPASAGIQKGLIFLWAFFRAPAFAGATNPFASTCQGRIHPHPTRAVACCSRNTPSLAYTARRTAVAESPIDGTRHRALGPGDAVRVPVVARAAGPGLSAGALPLGNAVLLSVAQFMRNLEID